MKEFNIFYKYMNIFRKQYGEYPTRFNAEPKILNRIVSQARNLYKEEELRTMGFFNITFIIDYDQKDVGKFQ